MKSKNKSILPWILKIAWRDSRTYRKRLFLYISAIILGVAALVAIRSFGDSLKNAVDQQSKSLLGADLSIESRQPFTSSDKALFDSLGGDQSQEVRLASMAYFPVSQGTRLVQVRALHGTYPYYGSFITEPAHTDTLLYRHKDALVDESLMIQYNVSVGDSVQIGNLSFKIAGKLKQVAGESGAVTLVGPRIYIPLRYLDQTGLIKRGSRARYRNYFHFPKKRNIDNLVAGIKPYTREHHLRMDTVQERKASLGSTMNNLYRFLSLVGFIALLLGAIGVASSIHVYIKQKINNIAVLRCLGAEIRTTLSIYIIQAFTTGLLGALAGALIGVGIQALLPGILKDFIPVSIGFTVYWQAILEGMSIALGFTLLFAMLPLITIRKISPLAALRYSYSENNKDNRIDYLRILIFILIIAAVIIFAVTQTSRWSVGLGFAGALLIGFMLLAGVARIMMYLIKKFFPSNWSYTWRQGLANLFRPNNQTLVLMVSIGLGTFLIMTLYITQHVLLTQASLAGGKNQPNMVLFDIQSNQVQGAADIVRKENLPVLQQVPIVTTRLAAVKGHTVKELLADSSRDIARWALRHEYRVTYRDSLVGTEKIVKGKLQKRAEGLHSDIKVSIAQRMADNLHAEVGDTLVFNVQGILVTTTVGSIRQVDWQRVQPNFFVVFPDNVLEKAPQFHVIVTRVSNDRVSAELQRKVIQRYPNISIIDLNLILQTINSILSKISFAIQFMALFSIFTGLIVLIGSIVTSRYQRIRESVLLRTMGASKNQILKIMSIEYFFLGLFAALTGIILSVLGSWALFRWVFDLTYQFAWIPLLLAITIVTILTVTIGLFNSRGIHTRPPLEILRQET
jgi:putative ABC transport system permease protein